MKTTQQSYLESERVSKKKLLEFNISSTKKSVTQCLLINFHFKTDFLFYKNTQNVT